MAVIFLAGVLLRPRQGTRGPRLILRVLGGLLLTAVECLTVFACGAFLFVIAGLIAVATESQVNPFDTFTFSPSELMIPALAVLGMTGTLAAWIHRKLVIRFPRLNLTPEETDFSEYLIQWTTIYLTVYQLVFETVADAANELKNATGVQVVADVALKPENLNLTILPLLFSIWVAIAIEKLYQNYGLPGEKDTWQEPISAGESNSGTGN